MGLSNRIGFPISGQNSMTNPLRIQYPGAWYHVTCRGNERRDIFADDSDRFQFLNILTESCAIYGVEIHGCVRLGCRTAGGQIVVDPAKIDRGYCDPTGTCAECGPQKSSAPRSPHRDERSILLELCWQHLASGYPFPPCRQLWASERPHCHKIPFGFRNGSKRTLPFGCGSNWRSKH
jgi:hypothetical protein